RVRVAAVPRRTESLLVRNYSAPSFGSALGFGAALGFAAAAGLGFAGVFVCVAPLAFASGLSGAGFSADSPFGFAAARAPPIAVISICVSCARWPVWRR